MRLREIVDDQRRLLQELTARISSRLETTFTDVAVAEPNIGIVLHERGHRAVMELPGELLLQAPDDAAIRESIRVRIKAARDRMLFRPPPVSPSRRLEHAPDLQPYRTGYGRPSGRGRR